MSNFIDPINYMTALHGHKAKEYRRTLFTDSPNSLLPAIKNSAYSLLISLCSGMDIFPTVLSLAGVTLPSDRRYDGIDATNILLHGEQLGHEVKKKIHFKFIFSCIHLLATLLRTPVQQLLVPVRLV